MCLTYILFLHVSIVAFDPYWPNNRSRKIEFPKCPHPHLSRCMPQIIGFAVCLIDLELVSYLLENVNVLEKMIINSIIHAKVDATKSQKECINSSLDQERLQSF